eukprot:TRINITY_DN25921_c0_g2_i1.p1 TRINITY_DN25921_c0_g2~~TRINITY_DN25921_c0_g2_i1.p1  ORF type:complete len:280 (+),score=53.76 TRINITY_DN25921_c0_g2_i1:39-842(+)
MATLERPSAYQAEAVPRPAVTEQQAPSAPAAAAPPAAVEAPPAPAVAPPPAVTEVQAAEPATRRPGTTLTPQEKREATKLSELYSILVAVEHLENAFVRAAIANEDYERHCKQLIAQFKTMRPGVKDKASDLSAFAREHGLECPLAEERLRIGMPATAIHAGGSATAGKESLACFKASEGFITLCDALKLDLKAVDELLPLVRDLQAAIVGIPNLPPLAGLDRITSWLVNLNTMPAHNTLTEEQCRQLALDVEQAYTSLKNWLQDKT